MLFRNYGSLLAMLLFIAMAACLNNDEDTSPVKQSQKSIGPSGGTIETADGVVLTIPEGALDNTTLIKISKINRSDISAAEPQGAPYVGNLYSFEPHGQTFRKPVHIDLPTNSKANTVLRLQDPEDTHWKMHSSISFTENVASFQTTEFSIYTGGGAANLNPSGGAFWSSVTASVPQCIPVVGAPGVEICGNKAIKRIEIVEESTAEIIGSCSLENGNMRSSSSGSSMYEFSCELIEKNGSTEVKISSNQANLPLVHVYWYGTDANSPGGILYEEYLRASVVNKGGQAWANPYTEKEFEFGGFKQLIFRARDKGYDFMLENALNPLLNAGYQARIFRYTTESSIAVAVVDVYCTLDARVLIEENILKKKGWKIKSDGTKGNMGTYEYVPPLVIGAMPIFVTDQPHGSEKPVSGNIMVTRGSEGVTDATVTLNGTIIPHWTDGLYDVEAADVPMIAPGSTVTIVATTADPQDSRTISFVCPPDIQFTSPTPTAIISGSQKLNVSWSPAIPYDHAMRIAGGAMVGIYACYIKQTGNEVSKLGHGAEFITLNAGQTNQSIDVGDCRRYLLELQYPGDRVIKIEDDGAIHIGYCTQRRRMMLQGAE